MAVNNPGETARESVDNSAGAAFEARERCKDRTSQRSLRPQDADQHAFDSIAADLERERYGRPVPEFRPAFSRDYLDLLAIADADIRTQDDEEEKTA